MDNIITKIQNKITNEIDNIKYNIYNNLIYDTYKSRVSYEDRCNESLKILSKYPNRIPIIIDYYNFENKKLKNKFLVNKDTTLAELIFCIRKEIGIKHCEAIFIYFNNSLIPHTKTMGEIYSNYMLNNKSKDKFLYGVVAKESTFGK